MKDAEKTDTKKSESTTKTPAQQNRKNDELITVEAVKHVTLDDREDNYKIPGDRFRVDADQFKRLGNDVKPVDGESLSEITLRTLRQK